MSTTIYVSSGAKEYVGGVITEINGKDISGATFQIALNASQTTAPTVWMAPSINIAGATTAIRIVKLLIDNTVPLGKYNCWIRVTDGPEIIVKMTMGNVNTV